MGDNVDMNGKKTAEPKQIATLTRDKLAQHDQGGDVEDASVSPLEKTSGESTNDQVDAGGDFDKTISSAVICYDIDDTVPVMGSGSSSSTGPWVRQEGQEGTSSSKAEERKG